MLGDTSSCLEECKQEEHPDFVLESLPTEVAPSNDKVGTKNYVNEIVEASVETANYVEDQKMQDLPQNVPHVIDSEFSAKICGDASLCLGEGKQEQHQDCVLESLPTEVAPSNDQVGTKNYVYEVGEASDEAADYAEDQKMQDLPQDVPHVIDSEYSAKECGDASSCLEEGKQDQHQGYVLESLQTEVAPSNDQVGTKNNVNEAGEASVEAVNYVEDQKMQDLPQDVPVVIDSEYTAKECGETSSCLEEGKQDQPQGYVLESLQTEVAPLNDQVGTKNNVNEAGEASVEAVNYVEDQKMQDLPQDVPHVINSEYTAKECGDTSSCFEEGKQDQPQGYVLESLQTEVAPLNDQVGTKNNVNEAGEASVEAVNYVEDQKMQDLPQDVPHVIDSEYTAKECGDTSSCLEQGKQDQHQGYVLESLPTEVAPSNDQVGTKNNVNEVGEASVEAADYVEDQIMQDLPQDVPHVIDSEYSAKECGDASLCFEEGKQEHHQDYVLESLPTEVAPSNDQAGTKICVYEVGEASVEAADYVEDQKMEDLPQVVPLVIDSEFSAKESGDASLCLEDKQEQHQDYVLESLPTEVAPSNNQVGTKNYVNEVGEANVEAANYVEDQKMQDLPQDVQHIIDSEFTAKNCGDASGFQNVETEGHHDHNVENIRGRDSEEAVGLEGKNSDVGLEEASNITLKHVVHEQLENYKESKKGLEEVGGQPSLGRGNESATVIFPSEAVPGASKDVAASGSHPENAKPGQTYEVSVHNYDALPISTENELTSHPASRNKEDVPFGGIEEIHPEDRTCVLATQHVEIPAEVISGQEQPEAQSENPKKNPGRRYKTIAKVTNKSHTLRSSLSSDRAVCSKSVDNAKDVDENEKANATTTEVKKRGRKKNSEKNVTSNEYSRIRKNLSYMLNRIRYEQSLIDAYSGEGWKGMSLEKLRPDKEIERAKSEIVRRKLKIRELFQNLDSLCAEGKLSEDLFDSEGMIDSEDIFCAKCGSKDLTLDNDIILCDGFCERGFHQFCLEPPLPKEDIPPDNEGWLCPGCDCKAECLDLVNELQGTKLSMKDRWEKVFPEAVKSGNLEPNSGLLSTDDSEDDDYDPEKPRNDEEGNESGTGGSEYATASEKSDGGPPKDNNQDLELPSDDSEDDDYDPDAPDLDKVKVESSTSDFSSDSEDLAAILVDEGPVGGKKQNLDDASLMESDTGESGASPITAKRHVPRLDYKKLHDEEYGGMSSDESSDDEEWTDVVGTKKRKRQMDEPEPSAKRIRIGKHSVSTKTSAGAQINDSPKSNRGAAKGKSSNPKRKLSKEAKERLQVAFNTNHFPDRATKESLAQELGITYQQVDKWFGNARWFFNHPTGRKINVSGKAAVKSNNPVAETATVGNAADNAAGCSNNGGGDQSADPGKKLEEESPKSNKKTGRPRKTNKTKTPQGQNTPRSRRKPGS